MSTTARITVPTDAPEKTAFRILSAISFCHMLNDLSQSLLPAIYPILNEPFRLSSVDIGLITVTFQPTAPLLQPFVGSYTDRRLKPYSLSFGMGLTLIRLTLLASASSFPFLLVAAALLGLGPSIVRP